jgi:hypothetical protein
MKKIITALTAVVIFLVTTGYAQEAQPLEVFGYFQAKFAYSPKNSFERAQNSFNIQQMNILLRKELGHDFSAFVNVELTNSFSSERNWGALNLEEAWVKYQIIPELSIKGGLLIPTFNNLNAIKSKTPLLPYIVRPVVYESSMSVLIGTDYVPERAYIQLYGTKTLGDVDLNYAAYTGNSETSYITTGVAGSTVTGNDTTTFKMIGGRVGISTRGIKAGISGTYDRKNVQVPVIPAPYFVSPGNVPRVRIGGDLSFKVDAFSFEGEFILVRHTLNDFSKAALAGIVQMTTDPRTGKSPFHYGLDKKFGYVNLMYDINDQWYVYAGYDYLSDEFNTIFNDGLMKYSVGGGFRPIDQVVLKAQYIDVKGKNEDFIKLNYESYNVAVSILF